MTTPNHKEQGQVAVTANISTELSKHLQDLAVIKSVDIDQLASRYIEESVEHDLVQEKWKQS